KARAPTVRDSSSSLDSSPAWTWRDLGPKERVPKWSREARYADAALSRAYLELANTPGGHRNNELRYKAYALGRMIAPGWIGGDLVVRMLEKGAHECGLVRDDGIEQVRATLRSGLLAGIQNPYKKGALG